MAVQAQHGHLFLADLNPRFGTEAGKLRPVVVMQTDYLNRIDHPSTWILPCTTKLVGENISRVPLPKGIAGNSEACEVMIDQSRSIDNKRLKKHLGQVPASFLRDIKDKLKLHADL